MYHNNLHSSTQFGFLLYQPICSNQSTWKNYLFNDVLWIF